LKTSQLSHQIHYFNGRAIDKQLFTERLGCLLESSVDN